MHSMPSAKPVEIETFEAWVDQWGDRLYQRALLGCGDAGVAEDLVQETFIAAWECRDQFRGDSQVSTWLHGILMHKLQDWWRRQSVRRRYQAEMPEEEMPEAQLFDAQGHWLTPPADFSPERLCEQLDFWHWLETCLAHLSPRQQVLFRRHLFAADDAQTLCKDFEISATNLRVLLYRARLKMRQCLERAGWRPGDT